MPKRKKPAITDEEMSIRMDRFAEGMERIAQMKRAAKRGLQRNYTRASFDGTSVWSPVPLTGDAPFCPVGQTGTAVAGPRMKAKNMTQWIIFRKQRNGKLKIANGGFTRCCTSGKCKRKNCAKCWALENDPPRGSIWVLKEFPTPENVKIIDTDGVSPRGHRGEGGKALIGEDADRWRITSTIENHKGKGQRHA